ncbi:Caspase domain-containing protein [Humidesulfovibrio mexicanus]|uniref:Caspase domain-containing protein n=1 Tax=Humidesulfovibrio mexicanus TaxID=147047 RepID=A0A239D4Q5_9BACT|nr:caspase family protein [Humidesulfovibrio mexicanus]SNS26841.1 Caspase domain-containing protein [Humidesulfovibrio mexicanus]
MPIAARLLLVPCILALLATPSMAERRVALVIGNGAYKDAPLKNPTNDARDMAAELQKLGFEVMLRENATLRQMEDALDQFWASIRQGGTGLFFFAGHGLQVKGVNYLVPVDARILVEQDVRSACLDANRVLGRMENAGNGLNILLLDACRNNPFARSWRSADAGLAKMDAPTGTLIGYATAPDSVAADGTGRNGVYTRHLLEQMRAPGQSIEAMLKRVRIGVLRDTDRRQTPWESSSLTGDFFFNPQDAPASQLAPLPATPEFDAKARKKRLAEEAARLKLEKEQLAQMQALQAEQERLEAERQKVEQAKLLAMAPRPKQPIKGVQTPTASSHAAQFAQLARAGQANAREHFQRAIQGNPDDAEARAGLAIALVFAEQDADAAYQVKRLSESSAQTPGVRLAQALLAGMARKPETPHLFALAAEAGADRALVLLCQATAAERSLQYEEGLARLQNYAALVPEGQRSPNHQLLAQAMDVKNRLAGRYAIAWGQKESPSPMVIEFAVKDGVLVGTAGGAGEHMRLVSITNILLQGNALSFQCDFRVGLLFLGGSGLTYKYSAELGRDLSAIRVKVDSGQGRGGMDWLVRLPDAR